MNDGRLTSSAPWLLPSLSPPRSPDLSASCAFRIVGRGRTTALCVLLQSCPFDPSPPTTDRNVRFGRGRRSQYRISRLTVRFCNNPSSIRTTLSRCLELNPSSLRAALVIPWACSWALMSIKFDRSFFSARSELLFDIAREIKSVKALQGHP